MKKNFVLLILVISSVTQAQALKDKCLNAKKEIEIQGSETNIKKISYTTDNKVVLESAQGQLKIDCKRAATDGKSLDWTAISAEPKISTWDWILKPGKVINHPLTFRDDKEFPLRTEVTVTPLGTSPIFDYIPISKLYQRGGLATAIQIQDKDDSSGKSLYAVCTPKGFGLYSKEGSQMTALYVNEEDEPVRDLKSTLPPQPLLPGQKYQDRVPVREPCHHSYVLDVKSGKVTAAKSTAPKYSPPTDVPQPPKIDLEGSGGLR